MTATPVWFGPPGRALFGWVHAPEDGRADGAVVLCPPLTRELNSAQSTFGYLAEEIAAAGMLAIRFDYDGTGDSVGDDRDPDRVHAWIASVGHAVGLARRCGVGPVSILGMRMGAWLGAAAAPYLDAIEAVVLWDPCTSGRAFVREKSALLRLLTDEPADSVEGTQLLGYVFSDETVADLGALAVPAGGDPPSRVLLLSRPDRAPLTALADALGGELTQASALGQEDLLEVDPAGRQIPVETVETIVTWLRGGREHRAEPVTVPRSCQSRFEHEGAVLTERVVRLGATGMFGIATTPEITTSSPTVLMLNAGNDSHIGPSRLWVDLSRRWAAAGLRCVRFDFTGIGDSAARPGKQPNVVRSPDAFDDMADVRAAVEPSDPSNVILVGLCSGGYQALEDALRSPVRGVYAINPVLHFTPPELESGPMDPRRRICWPIQGLSLAYRSILMEPVRRRLRHVAWFAAHSLSRHRDRNPGRWLPQLRHDGVRVFVVCGEDQAFAFGRSRDSRQDPTVESDPVRIDVIPGLDGALMPGRQRADVTAQLTAHVIEHFCTTPRDAPQHARIA